MPARQYQVQEVMAVVGLVPDDVCSSAEVVRVSTGFLNSVWSFFSS